MSTKPKSVRDLKQPLVDCFMEREDVAEGMLIALLSKQMLFLLGLPGTGKSDISNVLCSMIEGNFFSWMVSKFTTPEELYGPYSMKALSEDRFVRQTRNKLPEADIAFIDEIFKANSAILNTLLPIINERTFYNGPDPIKIPLQTLFGASNEIPETEELAPFWDRFVLRYDVQYIQEDDNMKALLRRKSKPVLPSITMDELKAEQVLVEQMNVPDAILDLIMLLRDEVKQEGIIVSDRKWVQITQVIKAQAYLNGHKEVQADDLSVLQNILWSDPEQIKRVRAMVAKHANPMGQDIFNEMDNLNEVLHNYTKAPENNRDQIKIETHKKVRKAVDKLKGLRRGSTGNAQLEKAISTAETKLNKFVRDELGVT
jgi:MoxR-like ATPase